MKQGHMKEVTDKLWIDRNNRIGKGGFGEVFSGLFENIIIVAAKRIVREFTKDGLVPDIKEIEILRRANGHANILHFYGTEMNDDFLFIVTELCQGTLEDYVDGSYTGPRFEDEKYILRQMTEGLAHLHNLKIVHRDIKPNNILVYLPDGGSSPLISQPQIKLADFGLSRFPKSPKTDQLTNTNKNRPSGTKGWRAPELYECDKYNSMADIFPLGCVFSYMITGGKHPFGDDKKARENRIKRKEKMVMVPEDLKVFLNTENDVVAAYKLIQAMVEIEPVKRLTADQILQHDFFRENKPAEAEKNVTVNVDSVGPPTVEHILNDFFRLIRSSDKKPQIDWARSRDFLNFCRYNLYEFPGSDSDQLFEKLCGMLDDETIDVNVETRDGWNALHLICRIYKGDNLIVIVQKLLHKGADAAAKTSKKWNALHFLFSNHRDDAKLKDIVTLLIGEGAEIKARTSLGWTPLHLLCYNYEGQSMVDLVEFLVVKHGASLHTPNNYGDTPLNILAKRGCWHFHQRRFYF